MGERRGGAARQHGEDGAPPEARLRGNCSSRAWNNARKQYGMQSYVSEEKAR